MSSLSAKDRVSLCSFTFSDGRRCRTPRTGKNPRFCFYHAQKEARARTAETLGKDLAYFFSGDYLSACDLSTALARLIPAVVRGDVKPRTARTVAYMAQTLLQAIHISEQEYINTFGTDGWRKSIRNSVNSNHDYLFPPDPKPEQRQSPQPASTPAGCHSERREEPAFSDPAAPSPTSSAAPPQTHAQQLAPASQPAPSPHTSLPPTSAEFVQHVLAGQNPSRPPRASQGPSRQPGSAAPSPASQPPTTPPAPGPGSAHSSTTAAQSTPSLQLPAAGPTTSPTQSSTALQRPGQEPPDPLRTVAVAPSAPRQEARPAAGPQTGPSGLPVRAPLPPRKPGTPPGSYSS